MKIINLITLLCVAPVFGINTLPQKPKTFLTNTTNNYQIISWYDTNGRTIDIISKNMYVWEVESALIYELSNKVAFGDTTFLKSLFVKNKATKTVYEPNINNWIITNYEIQKISYDHDYIEFQIFLQDGNNNYALPPLYIGSFSKHQNPTEIAFNNPNYYNVLPSTFLDDLKLQGHLDYANLITFNKKEHNHQIIGFNNNVQTLTNIYPSLELKDPVWVINFKNPDDTKGSIDIELTFTKNDINPNGFNIAYFDHLSKPIRFTTNTLTNTWTIYGFKINIVKPSIFAGQDGNFLFMSIIAIVIATIVSIIFLMFFLFAKYKSGVWKPFYKKDK